MVLSHNKGKQAMTHNRMRPKHDLIEPLQDFMDDLDDEL